MKSCLLFRERLNCARKSLEDYSRVKIIDTKTTGLREVATNPSSIYYASAPEVVPQCLVKTLPLAATEDTPLIPAYQSPFAELAKD